MDVFKREPLHVGMISQNAKQGAAMAKFEVQLQVTTHDNGQKTYVGELRHDGLGKKRVIRDTSESPEFVRVLMRLQWSDWETRFNALEQKNFSLEAKFPAALNSDDRCRDKADTVTRYILEDHRQLESILTSSLSVNSAIDWDEIKARFVPFSDPPRICQHYPKSRLRQTFQLNPIRILGVTTQISRCLTSSLRRVLPIKLLKPRNGTTETLFSGSRYVIKLAKRNPQHRISTEWKWPD
jgi:hypothetical protein